MAIEVRGLRKAYGDFVAVDGIDLDVAEGEILAFLGPNGAGKTTTIEILEGFRPRDGGQVTVLGRDPADGDPAWRERVGIVLQESEPVPELTAREAVRMHAGYYSKPRNVDEVLEIVGLSDHGDQRTRKLSGGQKRRLDLALALVGDPELVFLDEPTTGFDPSARRESWGMIERLQELGRTVMLTTHYMDEAEQLADRIMVIAGGRVVANGTAAELAHQVDAKTRISWRPEPDEQAPPPGIGAAPTADGLLSAEIDGHGGAAVDVLHALTSWARANAIELAELNVARPTLEDVYLLLTADAALVDGPSTGEEVSS